MLKRVRNAIKVLTGKAKAISIQTQTSFYCPVCKMENVHFEPLSFYYYKELDKHGYIHSIFQTETINREFYSCSNCNASDRDRLYALYFDKYAAAHQNKKIKILDIAPTAALTRFLKTIPDFTLRTADLFMKNVDDVVDITNMICYKDQSFDAFICSHVLEHIEDDIAAMKELYRVLVKGGWGIAMVPINLGLDNTYENYSIKDEAGRWKHFGQNDHVRVYSKTGFTERLQSVGFTVQEFNISYFGADIFVRNGIHPRSVLYIVSK